MFCSSSSLFIKIIKLHNTWEMIKDVNVYNTYLSDDKEK